MKNVKDLINDISEKTKINSEDVDKIMLSMVDSLNNGSIGKGTIALNNLNKIANRKMKPDKIVEEIKSKTEFNEKDIRLVVEYMFENVIRPTVKKGGVPAMLAMLKHMKPKEQRQSEAKDDLSNYIM